MQVLIRRKGIILTASWDGLAKPSDKQLHYFFRVKPGLAITNADCFTDASVDVLSRIVQNNDRAFSMMQAPLSNVALLRGAWGGAVRDAGLATVGRTTLTGSQSPFVGMFSRGSTHTDAVECLITRWIPNAVRHRAAVVSVAANRVEVSHRALGSAGGRPALTLGEHANGYRTMTNTVQWATAGSDALNLLEHKVVLNSELQAVVQTTAPRQATVPLKAPLPSGALIQEQASGLNHAPEATSYRHMERVEVVSDPARHTQWSRTPRPTHYVLDSLNPTHDPEVIRRDAPGVTVLGFQGRALATLSAFATEGFVDTGVLESQTITKHGRRGNIAQLGTNGLTTANFTHSAFSGSGYEARGAFDGWSKGNQSSSLKKNLTGVANYIAGESAWREDRSSGQWIQVDFGQVVEGINGVLLGAPPGHNYDPNAMMKSVSIQLSMDALSWTTALSFEALYDNEVVRSFTPQDARFVRIYGHTNFGGGYMSVTHVEIYKV